MFTPLRGSIIKTVMTFRRWDPMGWKAVMTSPIGKIKAKKGKTGFILVEAIAAVAVVSICLTLIAQALLANFRAGIRFQERVRFLLAMENKLGLLWASNGPAEQLPLNPQPLEGPYDQLTIAAKTHAVNDHLKQVELTLYGRKQRGLYVATFIYNADQVKTKSYIP